MDDPLTDSLTDSFRAVSSGPAPHADWDDLSRRIEGRHRRQRNVLAGCAALVAVATGAGGYVLGDHGNKSLTIASDTPARAGGGAAQREKSAAGSAAQTGADGLSSRALPPMTTVTGDSNATPVLARRTGDGLEIRAWRSTYSVSLWQPESVMPPECIQVGAVNVGVMSDTDMGSTVATLTKATEPLATISPVYGMGGATAFVSVIVTSVDAPTVEVTYPDGTVDSSAPQNGVAVSASASSVDRVSDIVVATRAADGSTTEVRLAAASLADPTRSYAPGDGTVLPESEPTIDCTPRLPAPGEQPADPAAERAEIARVFTTLYDPSSTDEQKTDLVDDPTGVMAAYAAARSGGFADATENTEFVLTDLVFTSPTEAVLQYDIGIPGGSLSERLAQDRFGAATRVDGRWKASRQTVCADLALAGGSCDGMPTVPVPMPAEPTPIEGRSTGSAPSGSGGSAVEPGVVVPGSAVTGR